MATDLTALAVIERLRQQVGATWLGGTSECIESGSQDTHLTGITTAWTPTIDVLHKAIATRHNLIISMEPPFWRETGTVKTETSMGSPSDAVLESSTAYRYKKKLIDDHQLVLWRFNENYRALPENPRLNALARTLGYKEHEDAPATKRLAAIGAGVYSVPETSLIALARQAGDHARARALRVLGNPAAIIRRIALLPGYMADADIMAMVHQRDIDAVVCGEACEWEAFVYAEDWITAGWGKGMIMLGRAASEDPGAQELASWIKSFVPEVPVTGLATGEPFNYVPSHKA